MQSHVSESATLLKLWAWFETNKKQVAWAAVGLVVLGIVIGFIVWHRQEQRVAAGQALSEVFVPQAIAGSEAPRQAPAYLNVANTYPSSMASTQARLLAAGDLFEEGKYSEAQAQFERVSRENSDNAIRSQAALGVAACLDAQGKSSDAIAAYKSLIDRFASENVVPQAKFALARLYEAQNKPELAMPLYEDVAKSDPFGAMGSEAGMRMEELKLKHPELAPAPAAPAKTPTLQLTPTPARVETNVLKVVPKPAQPAAPIPAQPGATSAAPKTEIPAQPTAAPKK